MSERGKNYDPHNFFIYLMVDIHVRESLLCVDKSTTHILGILIVELNYIFIKMKSTMLQIYH